METLNATLLIKNTREKLAGKDTRTLAAIHAGVTVAAGLAATLLQFVLTEGIGNTSGLSGMGTRSILETIQTVLQWANMVLLPFWNLGFLYAALQWARGNTPRKEDLLTGFHRAGPCLGLLLNRAVLTTLVLIISINISSFIYMMTPASAPIAQMAAEAGSDMDALMQTLTQLTEKQTLELFYAMIPMLVIWLVLSAVILVPLLYRFRLAEYAILNHPGVRALPAMIISASLLRRRCWQLFKLDLRLWWYYGLKMLCVGICYAELLLGALGISLPIGGEAVFFVTYLLYLIALFCVETGFRPQVETAYASAYEALMEMGPAPRKNQTIPKNVPWDEQ